MLISVDTRDESADDLFSQLLRFDDDPSRSEILFEDLSLVQRAHLESSASTLGLEYEYSSISRKLRIFRPSIPSELDPAVEFLNFDPPTTTAGNEELDSVLDPPNDTTFDFDFGGSTTTPYFEWDKDLSNFSIESNIAEAPNLVSSFASQEHLNAFDMDLRKMNDIDAFLDKQSSINPSIEAKDTEKGRSSPPLIFASSAALAMEENVREDYRMQSGFGILTSLPSEARNQERRLGKDEMNILEVEFEKNPKPTTQTKRQYSEDMGVSLARINVNSDTLL
jgi:hypothetical protein